MTKDGNRRTVHKEHVVQCFLIGLASQARIVEAREQEQDLQQVYQWPMLRLRSRMMLMHEMKKSPESRGPSFLACNQEPLTLPSA